MKNLYFTFLTVCVNAMISTIPSNPRTAQSSSDDTFEKKIEEGYEMLKNESSINETIAVVMELHNMEEKIVKQLISSPEANALFLDEIRNHTKFIGRNRTEPVDGRTIEEVNEKNKVNMVLFEGDVILTKEQAHRVMDDLKHDKAKRTKRQAHRSATRLWPSGIVYYSFDSSATDTTKRLFKKASDAWSRDTCVEFKEDDKASDRVVVHETLGCVSHIGKVGGKQKIYLGQLCESIGYVAHEIGHTLGLFHTQSRPDRDEYVRVVVENIRKDFVSQFRVQSEDVVNNYDLPYEYGSIMHYSARSASKSHEPSVIPYDVNYLETLGSPMISFYDKLMINHHYGCLEKCKKKRSADCQNGGFPHPRDCSKCVCPSGYGGKYCNEKPNGCGAVLRAKTSFQTLTDIVGQPEYNPGHHNDEFIWCYYWIKAPTGSTIEVKFDDYTKHGYSDGCKDSGVEIKTGNDKRSTGYRFCDDRLAGTALNSTFNIVPVITYGRFDRRTTVLSYRIASSDPKTKCTDNFLCKALLKVKPCTPTYNGNVRRKLCPKSCGFCL